MLYAPLPCRVRGIAPGYAHLYASGMVPPRPGLSSRRDRIMPLYETVLIARNDLTQQQVEAIADQLAATLAEQGGDIKKREYWGLRGLAYKIKNNRKGQYMLLGIDAPAAAEREADRQLGLNEDVLRHMTLKIETIDENPSAILARRGDDRERDRGFRGPRPAGRFTSGRRERSDEREEFRARSRDDNDMGEEG
jgi:small subunit ribosomal protein S6